MSVLSAATRSQRGTLGDLAVMWVALFGAFAYLDVPLLNAPLFAIALVLQAALGTFVITQLLDGLQPSLLLLCGPGLILGGALSFAVFQLTGRGAVGSASCTLAGVVAAMVLARRNEGIAEDPRIWIVCQLFGLAATAMMREFSELLPIAVLMFVFGFAVPPNQSRPRWVLRLLVTMTVITVVVTVAIRQEYWWLVTDDYQFFEVLSRHLTVSGPLADWGSINYSRYHWLSYGWSGLLNLLGGSPAPFVTIARVIPFVYSLALAASLVLICRQTVVKLLSNFNLLPVWVVIVIAELDWSGTSTAGAYGVLASVSFLLLHLAKRQTVVLREMLLMGIFALIAVLTKLPSVFAILALGLAFSTSLIADKLGNKMAQTSLKIVRIFVTCCTTISLIWRVGPSFGWKLELLGINPDMGQLSESGKTLALVALIFLRLPLWVVVVAALLEHRSSSNDPISNPLPHSSMATAYLALGLLVEVSIVSFSNVYLNLSGPLYFVASLSIMPLCRTVGSSASTDRTGPKSSVSNLILIGVGLVWSSPLGSRHLWNYVDEKLQWLSDSQISALRLVTADSRFGATLGAVVLIALFAAYGHSFQLGRVLLLPLVVLVFIHLAPTSVTDFRNVVSHEKISTNLGSLDIRSVADALRRVSLESDLIATNHLYDSHGDPQSDFSLAAWSNREFLILGPRFAGFIDSRRSTAIYRSLTFADSPNPTSCRELWNAGVRWFVVDLRVTKSRNWSICSDIEFSTDTFVLLSLREAALD